MRTDNICLLISIARLDSQGALSFAEKILELILASGQYSAFMICYVIRIQSIGHLKSFGE